MSDRLLSIGEASEALDVPVHTLRRWAEWHAAHLSANAAPERGRIRKFTADDIAVLGEVKRLRDSGLQTVRINELLGHVNIVEAAASPQEGPQATQTALAVWNDLAARLTALETASEASQRQQAAAVRDEVAQLERRARLYFAAGVGVTLLIIVVVVLVLRWV